MALGIVGALVPHSCLQKHPSTSKDVCHNVLVPSYDCLTPTPNSYDCIAKIKMLECFQVLEVTDFTVNKLEPTMMRYSLFFFQLSRVQMSSICVIFQKYISLCHLSVFKSFRMEIKIFVHSGNQLKKYIWREKKLYIQAVLVY